MENEKVKKKLKKQRRIFFVIAGIIILMVGALTYQHYNQGLETSQSQSVLSSIKNLWGALTINPIRTAYNGNYKVFSKSDNESLYDVTFNKTQVSLGFITYYDEELKKNVSIEQFRQDTIICLEAGWDEKEIVTYKDEEQKEIDKNYTYPVPSTLSFYKTTELSKQTDITRELEKADDLSPTPNDYETGDTYKFCYQANPEQDFYLKFGDNSVIVIQGKDIVGDSLLTNVTAESGDANFTHLTISDQAPYDSLVGYWNFDGDNVNSPLNTSYDFSKENNDGTMVADAVVNSTGCIYGDCLQLDGNGDYVNLGDASYVEGIGELSISVWVKSINSAPPATLRIVSKSGVSTDTFSLYWGSTQDVDFDVDTSGGSGIGRFTNAITDTNWHHIVGVYNGTNVLLYRDAVLGTTAQQSLTGTTLDSAHNLEIGASGGGAAGWNGTIDEVMIFNTSLTAQQILDIYNNQSARFVEQGTQKVRAVNITNTTTWDDAGNNRVNLTTTYETNMQSNISARIGQMNLSVDPDGLVLYMPFEWGSAVDISGFGNDGTLVDDTFFNETGGLNDTGGFEFDGDGDYVDMGDSSSTTGLDFGNFTNFTISAWIKTPTPDIQSFMIIYTKQGVLSCAVTYAGITFKIGYQDLYADLDDGPNDITVSTTSNPIANANQWYHVIFVTNRTFAQFYIDGVAIESPTDVSSIGNITVPNCNAVIGRQSDHTLYSFNGTIDDVLIFNRSLTATEISQLYNETVLKYNTAYYTDYQNITGDDEFTINKEADFIFPDFKLWAGNMTRSFYTPLLQGDITLEIWNFTALAVGDTEAPKVYLLAPPDSTSGSTQTHSFNMSFTDNINVTNATYYLWNSSNHNINLTAKILGGTKSESWNLTATLPYEDTFKWNAWACDNSTNCAFNSTNYTITYSVDTCTCAGLDQDWEIDMSDYCNITDDCYLGTGRLSWTGSGWANCSAEINTTNMERPDANQLLHIAKDCVVNIFSWFLGIIKTPFLPLIQALSVTNTNFSTSGANNFVSVDSMTLTKLVINDTAIELYNISLAGTDFTNVNPTYNATLYFYGLIIDLAVYDVNRSYYVFNATIGNQDYGATFKSKQLLRILSLLIAEYSRVYSIIPNIELSVPYVQLNETLDFT